jgi:hypothetical protein
MSYQPQGYPQQQHPGDQPLAAASTSPVTAVIAAILALGAAAALAVLGFDFLSDVPEGVSFSDFPSELKTVLILDFAAAAVLLIGAILVLARKLAGAVILVIGALAGITAILVVPPLADASFSDYFEEMFKFDSTGATMSALALILSPLALIVALLPPTLRYVRGSRQSLDAGYPESDAAQNTW